MASKKWLSLALVLALHCGDKDKDTNPDAANETDMGSSPADMSQADVVVSEDVGADATSADMTTIDPGGCVNGITPDVTIDVDPGQYAGQFHARAAWDGAGAWVVYNRPDSTGAETPEQIFAVHVGCDGAILQGPLRLSAGTSARNYMPVVASRGGITHVAWVEQAPADNPGTIMLVQLTRDGSVKLGPVEISPQDANGPISELAWEPDLAVWEDGSGVVATSTGVFGSLDIALQKYDATGARSGDAFFPYAEQGVDQKRPTVAADPDGTIYVGWTRYKAEDTAAGTPEEPETAVITSIPSGANMAFPATPLPAKPLSSPNAIARYAKEPGLDGAFFLAFQASAPGRQDILVRDGADFQTADAGTFGSTGWVNFRASVATGKAGGVVAWYRYNETPLKNTLMIHPFAFNNGTFIPGTEHAIETTTPGIPPYGPDVTWAGGSVYFVAWGEGDSGPEARVKGRWVIVD